MAYDASSSGEEHPALRAEDWSKERYEGFLREKGKEIPTDVSVEIARGIAKKLLLAEQVRNLEGLTPEQRDAAERQADRITGKYLDELTATMEEGLAKEGSMIRGKFIALVDGPVRGRNAMENRLEKLEGFTEKDKGDLRKILSHFALSEDSEDGKSYLSRWLNRDATNGRLVQQDYPTFQRIQKNVPKGSPEEAFMTDLHENLLELRRMDPQNLTFVRSTPSVSPGGRFVLTLLLGSIALLSLLMARKSGRMSKKGLLAIGLLLYLHRNPDSRLSALSSSRYEELTKTLRGTPEGKVVIEELGHKSNKEYIKNFAKREKQRMSLPPGARGDLISETESRDELCADLGLKDKAAEKLKATSTAEILALSKILQKFNDEELDIAAEFTGKEGASRKDIPDAGIDTGEKT